MSTYTSFAPDWREPPTPTTSFLDPDLSYDDDMDEKMSEKSSDLSSDDLEAQSIFKEEMRNKDGPILAAEYRTSMRVKLMYLSGYFLLNLSLTLYNKALLGNVSTMSASRYRRTTYPLRISSISHGSSRHCTQHARSPAVICSKLTAILKLATLGRKKISFLLHFPFFSRSISLCRMCHCKYILIPC